MVATTAQAEPQAALPTGPPLPVLVQTLAFALARTQIYPLLRKRYGDTFTIRLPGRNSISLSNLDDIRTVFAGDPSVFHAGEGNEILRPIMGDNSLLLLDEDAHRRARKLLMPAFSGAALRGYRDMITEISTDTVRSWRPGRQRMGDRMRELTLDIICRVVFGVTDTRRLAELRPRVTATTDGGFLTMFGLLFRDKVGQLPPWRGFLRNIDKLDELLYAEIADRRAHPTERNDVLWRMMSSGELSDIELRDELMTLLLAGHETTANALAWTFHELARQPELMAEAVHAADQDGKEADDFLEACVKEAMRLRPVITQVARRITEPVQLGDHLLPKGSVLAPSIFLVQAGEHEDPQTYRPGRFFDGSVTSANWLPFGGGVRRCIGAGFSLMESVVILRAVLREYSVTAVGPRERMRPRNITTVPAKGARVVLTAR